MSADGISAVLNQRFPELAAAIPSLDTTNGKIGDVKSAVDLVRQALETVNVTLADLHLKQSALPSASSAAHTDARPKTSSDTESLQRHSRPAALFQLRTKCFRAERVRTERIWTERIWA